MICAGMAAAALWIDAWLRGSAGSDDLLELLGRTAPDTPALVSLDGAAPGPLPGLLRALRELGAHRTWLLLPRPGRTGPWPREVGGTPEPAVLVSADSPGTAGLLRAGRSGWRWDSCPGSHVVLLENDMLTARAGARALAEVAGSAARRLEARGLERPATRAHSRVWERAMSHLPPGSDQAVRSLLIRLATLHDALDLALLDEGGAVTAAEAHARAGELRTVVGEVEDIVCGVIGGVNAAALGPRPGR